MIAMFMYKETQHHYIKSTVCSHIFMYNQHMANKQNNNYLSNAFVLYVKNTTDSNTDVYVSGQESIVCHKQQHKNKS